MNHLSSHSKYVVVTTTIRATSISGPITPSAPCPDSVYYEQMIPPLIQAVHHAARAGKLGLQQAGNFLLARHEDRLVYIQIMEKGNGYMIYNAKGLELQETSCHSLEATRCLHRS